MKGAAEMLDALGVSWGARVVSAHRTPLRMVEFAQGARPAGIKVIIAGAGGAAHLPGMTASLTDLPVLGVPVESKALKGMDSLLSIVQMPAGVPVATLAIGEAGARNAGLLAASPWPPHALGLTSLCWIQSQTAQPRGSAPATSSPPTMTSPLWTRWPASAAW